MVHRYVQGFGKLKALIYNCYEFPLGLNIASDFESRSRLEQLRSQRSDRVTAGATATLLPAVCNLLSLDIP